MSQHAAPAATGRDAGYLRVFVFALFFIFGGITSLNDEIIPKLKELFTLSYAEVMTVQSAFFGAYFIISSHTTGAVSGWSLLAIGLCNSIMFPTIFSLASEGLGPRAASASGIHARRPAAAPA